MSLLHVSSGFVGRQPDCRSCGAGAVSGFNWQYAKTSQEPDASRDLSAFVAGKQLRYGTLYECRSCGQPWYLCGDPEFMNCVPRERLELIHRWNEQPIVLRREHVSTLQAIGRTPPHIYGGNRQFHETPCAVTTVDGETIDMAIVSLQRHAPFEDWRNCRLATDLADVRPSPYALPLSVRVATSQAEEHAMGFAPTLVQLPDASEVALNWTPDFFVWWNCRGSAVVASGREFDRNDPVPIYHGEERIVYFVADPWNGCDG
jgi:hypothetical protein